MRNFRAVVCILVILLVSRAGMAQTQDGRILGTVTDQTGGAVRGAKVLILNVDTGVTRSLVTNETGDYTAPNLAPGMYRVTVEAEGFKKVERTSFRLEVAKDVRADVVLQPGSISQTVNVTEDVPMVETTNDTLGGTFTNHSINDLPLNGRDFQNLVVLRPGVQRAPGGGFLSISSNGNRPEDNNFIFDGVDNNDPYYGGTIVNAEGVQGTPGSILPIDAIQEFNALENPPAEYGWKPGAIVNLGIKSGTNDVHGTAYVFDRNSAFDARNYFDPATDPNTGLFSKQKAVRQHQVGASIGGPIVKNKTFIFGAYEGIRALVGNSEQVNSPATVTAGGAGNPTLSIPDAIAALQAMAVSVNPLSAQLLPLFPTNTNTSGLLNVSVPNKNRNDNFIIKADHHINDKNSLTGRYFMGDSLQTERDIPVLRPEWESLSQLRAQVVGANWTWLPSTAWVNEARFGYNRFWQAILTADHNVDPVTGYGINTGVTNPSDFGMPEISIGGFLSLGGNHGWPLLTTPNQTKQFVDNVSYMRGKHTFRFGGEFRHGGTNNQRDRYGKGRVQFRNGTCYATALENFLAGCPRRGRIFVGNSVRHVTMNSMGGFFQDDWKVSQHLTINVGVRYDLNQVIHEDNNNLANFLPTDAQGNYSTTAALGIKQVGMGIDAPYHGDHNNFAPRLGISWDPFGRGKTVIRAGGGITYEIPNLSTFLGQNGANNASTAGINVIPTASSTGIPGANGTIAASAVNVSGGSLNWTLAGPVFQPAIDCSLTPCDIMGVDQNLRTPYVMSWNLNVQQALGSTTSLQVGYVGNRGVKLYSLRDINQVDPNSLGELLCGNCEQWGRPFNSQFSYLGFINYLGNDYTSIYHGLQATLTQRAWKGMNFVAGYTWAHAIDSVSLNRAQQPQDSTRPGLERGSGDNDIRHRLTLAFTYELPGRSGYAHMLEGWQMNAILTAQTGAPWNLDDGYQNGNDISLTGEYSDRWNIVGNPLNIKPSTTGIPYYDFQTPATQNSACLAAANTPALQSTLFSFGCYAMGGTVIIPPAWGTFGTASRNPFRGPRLDNLDFSIVKTTKLNERISMQLRGEFFNALNHPHFMNPNTFGFVDPSDPSTFGVIAATPDVAGANPVMGTGGNRNIQLGLKFRF
jgi:hypothetical protein